MRAIILAAGRGTRLGPLGKVTSKAALPLLGKALITRVYESMVGLFDSVVVVVNPADEHIQKVLTTDPWNTRSVEIAFQIEPLGSADALRVVLPMIDGPSMVTACDNLMSGDYLRAFIEYFRSEQPDALVGVARVPQDVESPSSIVSLDESGAVQTIIEKPNSSQRLSETMALPLYAFKPSFFAELSELQRSERNEYEIPLAIQNFINRGGEVRGFLAHDRITINSPKEYLFAVQRVLDEAGSVQVHPGAILAQDSELRAPVFIEDKAVICSKAIVGPHAYIMSGSHVGSKAVVSNSIVFRGSEIRSKQIIVHKILLPQAVIDLQISRDSHDPVHRL